MPPGLPQHVPGDRIDAARLARLARIVGELNRQLVRLADELHLPADGAGRAPATDHELPLQRDAMEALVRIQRLFELSATDLGRMFGASRQAVSSWLDRGVPAARKPKLYTVLNIGELLDRKLKAGRLSAVVRRPASVYGGLSMLQMVEADRHEELLESVRESFNWAATA